METGGPKLSAAAARRIALAAQGFLDPRPDPGAVTTRHLNRVMQRVKVVQIDSVNVLTRSHYLPFFSRLGGYDTSRLDAMRDRSPHRLVEYWAHEASLIQPSTWPLLNFRMERARDEAWGGMRRMQRERPDLVAAVLQEVRVRGPITAKGLDVALDLDLPQRRDHWGWNWSAVKTALEYLFWAGEITSTGRTAQFERRYVVADKILSVDSAPDSAQAHVELMRVAAHAHGIGTAKCLRDYFRLGAAESAQALAYLVEQGELETVQVDGWKGPVYLHSTARKPRSAHVEALLSPFDSLIWQRERTESLFGMKYRLEIYTPAQKRIHGYYVLPFLYGDSLVARVDLKADRAAGVLRVQRCTWEPHAPLQAQVALEHQLRALAQWLQLEEVDTCESSPE
ncbi:winged helix-turn-helix domain-containing protein [Kocuria sp.]|uniref:winged helix-turn-helix domain-containing protein n=1 Tax=Kocuria sp. TaxID=1871328 RepID=UPI0026DFEF06|nr:crosslink repair DNA glycosylase YcaQ family protein [Kocuria sp.]MDO5617229.1 crosslink repair DNA glycosylase YcaQ family protein [Kocuria sp.]